MRRFADIKADSSLGRGRDRFRGATHHLRRAYDASAPKGRGYCTTPRRSGGWFPSQSFEFRYQMLECFEIADCCHRPDVQAIEHGNELRISDRLGQRVRLADSPRGAFHRLYDIRLQLRVGDGVSLLRSRDTPQYLAVDWIAENAPKAFDLARDSLIDGPPLDCRGVRAGCWMVLNGRTRFR